MNASCEKRSNQRNKFYLYSESIYLQLNMDLYNYNSRNEVGNYVTKAHEITGTKNIERSITYTLIVRVRIQT